MDVDPRDAAGTARGGDHGGELDFAGHFSVHARLSGELAHPRALLDELRFELANTPFIEFAMQMKWPEILAAVTEGEICVALDAETQGVALLLQVVQLFLQLASLFLPLGAFLRPLLRTTTS